MAIIGQNYGRRRRPKGPIILVVIAVALVGLLALAWSRGGEVPTQRVEKSIPLPAAATGGSAAGGPQTEG
ncbi:MAG: hypothetical protein Q27BB25_17455 [Blastomonas sp. CACIA14H2]|jgi:hypothetical protein|uniref:hypothetical protein n=1 Tax=unclassified Blastomonas TaxID=2626550 RepID=UPI0003D003DC|nr:hypothetical protein [Blastomonas sp. UPD001]ESZ85793.1 MAG: hypothetical protein Q27BB25_17455 [Blastomonas sp. CACIA14H2]MBL0966854.1 hypothetical protein [Blastomonas sp.]